MAHSAPSAGATVLIRPATNKDRPRLVELCGALFREDGGARDQSTVVDWPAKNGDRYFRDLAVGSHGTCWVADDAGRVCGYLVGRMRPVSDMRTVRVAELEEMYVAPQWRCTGIGGKLVDAFFEWAHTHGADRAAVTAYATNERALAFYRRHGFAPRSVSLERPL
jgi:GNAT superfamily N-acetyltransferase